MLLCLIGMFLGTNAVFAQTLSIEIDLLNASSEKIEINAGLPETNRFELTYSLPDNTLSRVKPETYLRDIEVRSKKDKKMSLVFWKDNHLVVEDGEKAKTIKYTLGQTKGNPRGVVKPVIDFEKDKHFFLHPAYFLGYVNNQLACKYDIQVLHPPHLFTSHPKAQKQNDSIDVYHYDSYAELLESPFFYAKLDTIEFEKSGIKTVISVYSENGRQNAQNIQRIIRPLIGDFQETVGDLALSEYHFNFIFFEPQKHKNLSFGAAFHSNETFFVLPEKQNNWLQLIEIQRLASHELFHTLCPFHLHSYRMKDIQLSVNRLMSKHLWLYEGVTEYLSLQMLSRYSRITEDQFWSFMDEKISLDKKLDKHSLLEVSENIFKPKYAALYPTFYNKAALVALMMDIRLTKNNQSLLSLVKEMSKRYGTDESFDENNFLEEIDEWGNGQLGSIIENYLVKKNELAINDYLELLGLKYYDEYFEQRGTYGMFEIAANAQSNTLIFREVRRNELGLEEGDILKNVNGSRMDYRRYLKDYKLIKSPIAGEFISMKVHRDGQPVELKAKAVPYAHQTNKVIRPLPNTNIQHSELKKKISGKRSID